jgi:hypothetical protein
MKTENLYVLQDGTYADPKACKKGDDGVLRHENGVGVALGANGEPLTVGEATASNAQAASAADGPADIITTDDAKAK